MHHPHTSPPQASSPGGLVLEKARAATSKLVFEPRGTVRCVGAPMFRTNAARDAACLADLDPAIERWSCLPLVLEHGRFVHVPDLLLLDHAVGAVLADVASGASAPPGWVRDAAEKTGHRYRVFEAADMERGFRLENARALLRYARWQVSLNDRVRLVSALDENGPLPVRACMDVLGTPAAMAAIAALTLRRFVEIDLDEAPIGPDSRVRLLHRS